MGFFYLAIVHFPIIFHEWIGRVDPGRMWGQSAQNIIITIWYWSLYLNVLICREMNYGQIKKTHEEENILDFGGKCCAADHSTIAWLLNVAVLKLSYCMFLEKISNFILHRSNKEICFK
jgi:hypothetical protein